MDCVGFDIIKQENLDFKKVILEKLTEISNTNKKRADEIKSLTESMRDNREVVDEINANIQKMLKKNMNMKITVTILSVIFLFFIYSLSESMEQHKANTIIAVKNDKLESKDTKRRLEDM